MRYGRRDAIEKFLPIFAAMTGQRVVFVGGSEAHAQAVFAGSRVAWDDALIAAGAFGPGGPYGPEST